MSTLNDMVEHCGSCGDELEIGQIGECNDCQDDYNQPQKSEPALSKVK